MADNPYASRSTVPSPASNVSPFRRRPGFIVLGATALVLVLCVTGIMLAFAENRLLGLGLLAPLQFLAIVLIWHGAKPSSMTFRMLNLALLLFIADLIALVMLA